MFQSLVTTIFASLAAVPNLLSSPGHLSTPSLSFGDSDSAMASQLFQNTSVGDVDLAHRVVLAPLTRRRADAEGVLGWLGEEYYRQRASHGGLLITEATLVAEEAGGQAWVPGIWSDEQIAAWRNITDAVHEKDGKIFCQLWALGRVASPDLAPDSVVYAPSPLPYVHYNGEHLDPSQLTVMSEKDIDRFVEHFARAGKNALEAGFDGVEIHGANGYLIDQFLQTTSNNRTDAYGGSVVNRSRFLNRIITALSEHIPLSRVGLRLSPYSTYQGMGMPEPLDTFIPVVESLAESYPELAYIHFIEGEGPDDLRQLRDLVKKGKGDTKVIVASGYGPKSALEHAAKYDDLVAFGRWFISNPDLPERIKEGHPLSEWDASTFYTRGPKGYIE
ncbi:hypothetical protein IAT38_008381 [Cryptococcus sp. DSM 104549]